MQLTPKEASLLKDLKGQEQLCVDKYTATPPAPMTRS